jgi:hypothetical protein
LVSWCPIWGFWWPISAKPWQCLQFELGWCVKSLILWPQAWAKTHTSISHNTLPYLLLPGSLISCLWDQWLVSLCPMRFLMTHQCQAMT